MNIFIKAQTVILPKEWLRHELVSLWESRGQGLKAFLAATRCGSRSVGTV